MATHKRPGAERDVGNPQRQGGVADQGGFEDEGGTRETGGGLGQGGLAEEGALNGAPSERRLMINREGRQVEDEAGYDEQKDIRPGKGDRPIVAQAADDKE